MKQQKKRILRYDDSMSYHSVFMTWKKFGYKRRVGYRWANMWNMGGGTLNLRLA